MWYDAQKGSPTGCARRVSIVRPFHEGAATWASLVTELEFCIAPSRTLTGLTRGHTTSFRQSTFRQTWGTFFLRLISTWNGSSLAVFIRLLPTGIEQETT